MWTSGADDRNNTGKKKKKKDYVTWRDLTWHDMASHDMASHDMARQERMDGRLEGMKEAEGLFAHRKDLQFQQACTREQAELLELQRYVGGVCVCFIFWRRPR